MFGYGSNQNRGFQNFTSLPFSLQNQSPEEVVKQLLKEGKMTQSQFEQFKIIADKIMGSKQ